MCSRTVQVRKLPEQEGQQGRELLWTQHGLQELQVSINTLLAAIDEGHHITGTIADI